MKKATILKKGDKVALVSLSSGMIGDAAFIHKYEIAKKRLAEEFGLDLIPMQHALAGSDFIYKNPQARAADLMDAFRDPDIKGIFCAIGGYETIRLLPYIDYDVIRNNPKIFMGYSDTTVNHFMMRKAGLVSFYGPAVMTDFGEYVEMHPYTKKTVLDMLFRENNGYYVWPSPNWSKDFVPWDEKNVNMKKKMILNTKKYEVLQGKGQVSGKLIGGCIEVFPLLFETDLWLRHEDWDGKILFIETSELQTSPAEFSHLLRCLAVQGVFQHIAGLMVGTPYQGKYYEEYKKELIKVLQIECDLPDLPVFYNVNIGHAIPTGILPFETKTTLDCERKTIHIDEPFLATE